MGEFTNILLGTLITLISGIAIVGYNKFDAFALQMQKIGDKIEKILISDANTGKDINQLIKDVDDHETRISTLEKTKQ